MSLETAISAHLKQIPDAVAMFGSRVFPVRIPQGSERPALAYQIVADVGDQVSGGRADLQRTRIQFTMATKRYTDLTPGIEAVVAGFSGFVGQMGGPGGALVEGVITADMPGVDDYDDSTEDFLRTRDVVFWWVRS